MTPSDISYDMKKFNFIFVIAALVPVMSSALEKTERSYVVSGMSKSICQIASPDDKNFISKMKSDYSDIWRNGFLEGLMYANHVIPKDKEEWDFLLSEIATFCNQNPGTTNAAAVLDVVSKAMKKLTPTTEGPGR